MKARWIIPTTGDERGNMLGYATANERMRQALSEVMDVGDDGDIAVHFQHPGNYQPVDDCLNVLFTMFEVPDDEQLRRDFVPAFERCDLVVTPSKFCLDLFRPYTDRPIEICPLGVDTALYTYKKRQFRFGKDTFRWLVVAAPNPRKYSLLLQLWSRFMLRLRRDGVKLELYFKTTGLSEGKIKNRMVMDCPGVKEIEPGIFYEEGFTLDNRKLALDELRDLYHSAHGFLGLHMGEGWNLPILEAMATGLPAIVTDWSSTQEFANASNAFLCHAIVGPVECGVEDLPSIEKVIAAIPDPADVTRHLWSIMREYPRAAKVGRRAANTAKLFSWQEAGRRLATILGHATRHLTVKSHSVPAMGAGDLMA